MLNHKQVSPFLQHYSPTPDGWVSIAWVYWLHTAKTPTLLAASPLAGQYVCKEDSYTWPWEGWTPSQRTRKQSELILQKTAEIKHWFFSEVTWSWTPQLVHTWGTLRSISSGPASGWWRCGLCRVYWDSPTPDKTPAGTEACQDRARTPASPALSRQMTNGVTQCPERSTLASGASPRWHQAVPPRDHESLC